MAHRRIIYGQAGELWCTIVQYKLAFLENLGPLSGRIILVACSAWSSKVIRTRDVVATAGVSGDTGPRTCQHANEALKIGTFRF